MFVSARPSPAGSCGLRRRTRPTLRDAGRRRPASSPRQGVPPAGIVGATPCRTSLRARARARWHVEPCEPDIDEANELVHRGVDRRGVVGHVRAVRPIPVQSLGDIGDIALAAELGPERVVERVADGGVVASTGRVCGTPDDGAGVKDVEPGTERAELLIARPDVVVAPGSDRRDRPVPGVDVLPGRVAEQRRIGVRFQELDLLLERAVAEHQVVGEDDGEVPGCRCFPCLRSTTGRTRDSARGEPGGRGRRSGTAG